MEHPNLWRMLQRMSMTTFVLILLVIPGRWSAITEKLGETHSNNSNSIKNFSANVTANGTHSSISTLISATNITTNANVKPTTLIYRDRWILSNTTSRTAPISTQATLPTRGASESESFGLPQITTAETTTASPTVTPIAAAVVVRTNVSYNVGHSSTVAPTSAPMTPTPILPTASTIFSNKSRAVGQNISDSSTVAIEKCEYGNILNYHFEIVVHGSFGHNITTEGVLLVKCLHQLNFNPSDDRLNGQKLMAQITSMNTRIVESTEPEMFDEQYETRPKGAGQPMGRSRAKRTSNGGFYSYFEHLWTDIKTMLPFEEHSPQRSISAASLHDTFDDEMLRSLKLDLRRKCSSWSNDVDPAELENDVDASPGDVPTNDADTGRVFHRLPFWFVQLDDGSIPQIGFTRSEQSLKSKNLKKFLTHLFERQTATNISENSVNQRMFQNLVQDERATQTVVNGTHKQTFDAGRLTKTEGKLMFNALGVLEPPPAALNDVHQFAGVEIVYRLWKVPVVAEPSSGVSAPSSKQDALFRQTEDRFQESVRESPQITLRPEVSTLESKHIRDLSRLRRELADGVNKSPTESHFYTALFERATKAEGEEEHLQLGRLVALEQQLNHTNIGRSIERSLSLIADLRRIGTLHNIQKACGQNNSPIGGVGVGGGGSSAHINIQNTECSSFISLLLESGSKTAQHALLFTVQNHDLRANTTEIVTALRLLARTHRPTRWLIEALAHELHRIQQGERSREHEIVFLQTLTALARRDGLVKLKQLISSHLVRLIGSSANMTVFARMDIIEMLGNLANYTALEQILPTELIRSNRSAPIVIAFIHAQRHALEREDVRTRFEQFFTQGPCQVRQEIVQTLIDRIDADQWREGDADRSRPGELSEVSDEKRWPRYGFNELDSLLQHTLDDPDENCAHHLIVQYLRRKSSVVAARIVANYETSQTFNATSFDFCLAESGGHICDFVQTLGTEVAGAITMKSMSIFEATQLAYTRHSFGVHIFGHRHTLGHLSVVQDQAGNDGVRLQYESASGETVPLGVFQTTRPVNATDNSTLSNSAQLDRVLLAKHWHTLPVKIIRRSAVAYLDSLLTMQLNVHLKIEIVRETETESATMMMTPNDAESANGEQTVTKQTAFHLVSTVVVGGVAELDNSDLIERRAIELQSTFQYESKQPIELFDREQRNRHGDGEDEVNGEQNRNQNSDGELVLGTELFHSQIELNHRRSSLRKTMPGLGCLDWTVADSGRDLDETVSSDIGSVTAGDTAPTNGIGAIDWSTTSSTDQRQQLSNWSSSLRQLNLFTLPWHHKLSTRK